MDPMTLQAGAALLGGMMSPAGPSAATGSSVFDGSGWNVNFGAGTIESSREQGGGAALSGYLPYAALAVGLLIAWRITRKR